MPLPLSEIKIRNIAGVRSHVIRTIPPVSYTHLTDKIEEGVFTQTSNEALVTENAKQLMGVAIGDPIAVETPDGYKLNFTISGFMNNTASIMSGDSYGIILNTEDYCAIYPNVSDGRCV